MAADMLDAVNLAFDKIFGPENRPRPFVPVERRGFADLSDGAQRHAICLHLMKHEYDLGLIGESINEHKRGPDFMRAFALGDTAEMGRLADLMIREYMADVVESAQS